MLQQAVDFNANVAICYVVCIWWFLRVRCSWNFTTQNHYNVLAADITKPQFKMDASCLSLMCILFRIYVVSLALQAWEWPKVINGENIRWVNSRGKVLEQSILPIWQQSWKYRRHLTPNFKNIRTQFSDRRQKKSRAPINSGKSHAWNWM